MIVSKEVGKNIKAARKIKGFMQKEMASMLHMTQQQYSNFETGKYELNYYQIVKICKLLEISPNEMFENCFD